MHVQGCLDKEEVLRSKNASYLSGAHVVVGTPGCLAECLQPPEAIDVMQHTKVLCVRCRCLSICNLEFVLAVTRIAGD
jgi:hypothetical protein